MYVCVCKDSAAPAHARTRAHAHRPAAPRQSSGVSQTPHITRLVRRQASHKDPHRYSPIVCVIDHKEKKAKKIPLHVLAFLYSSSRPLRGLYHSKDLSTAKSARLSLSLIIYRLSLLVLGSLGAAARQRRRWNRLRLNYNQSIKNPYKATHVAMEKPIPASPQGCRKPCVAKRHRLGGL